MHNQFGLRACEKLFTNRAVPLLFKCNFLLLRHEPSVLLLSMNFIPLPLYKFSNFLLISYFLLSNDTWKSNFYFIVNIDFFNGSNDLSNFLKCANLTLNVISTSMNDNHIRSLGSSRSDLVYNIICGGTRMASDFYWIVSKDLTPIHMLNHGISNDNYFFFWGRVYNTTIFFIIRIFIFSQLNLGTVIINRLIFPVIGRFTSIDRTTLATLSILDRNMMRLMVN